jgi:hypothetical protein
MCIVILTLRELLLLYHSIHSSISLQCFWSGLINLLLQLLTVLIKLLWRFIYLVLLQLLILRLEVSILRLSIHSLTLLLLLLLLPLYQGAHLIVGLVILDLHNITI